MIRSNDTRDQQHQKSHPLLSFPLNRIGEGHLVTTEDRGRPAVTPVGGRGGVARVSDNKGGSKGNDQQGALKCVGEERNVSRKR